MQINARKDPYLAFNFLVEIDGLQVGGFNEVEGLHLKIETITYCEGGGGGTVYHLAGEPRYGCVTLSRGMTTSMDLWDWVLKTVEGEIVPRQVSIVLRNIDPELEETRWNLANAWPREWKAGCFNALKSAFSIESLSLVFGSIKREIGNVKQVKENITA